MIQKEGDKTFISPLVLPLLLYSDVQAPRPPGRGLFTPSLYAELPTHPTSPHSWKSESHVVAIIEKTVPLNRKMAQVTGRRETLPFA